MQEIAVDVDEDEEERIKYYGNDAVINPSFHCNKTEGMFLERCKEKHLHVCRSGWPDFLIKSRKHIYAVEVKSSGDEIRDSQVSMFSLLEEAGINTVIWTPTKANELIPWRKFVPLAKNLRRGIVSDREKDALEELKRHREDGI